MKSGYWYSLNVLGGTEQERDEVRRCVQNELPVQDNGNYGTEKWSSEGIDESEIEPCLSETSRKNPHMLFILSEAYESDATEESTYETFYFGNGAMQNPSAHYSFDAVEEYLLGPELDRATIPQALLCNGEVSMTYSGGLLRIKPAYEDGNMTLRISLEKEYQERFFSIPISALFEDIA